MTIFPCKLTFGVALFALCAGATNASDNTTTMEYVTGNDLMKMCATKVLDADFQQTYNSMCLSYVTGVVDTHEILVTLGRTKRMFCLRPSVSGHQLVDVSVKYMKEEPESPDITGSFLVLLALFEAFPCPKNADQ